MGKGKAKKVGEQAAMAAGSTILAFSSIRSALLRKVTRQVQVRCPFVVGALEETGSVRTGLYRRFRPKKTQRRYLAYRRYELTRLFRQLNKAHMISYFSFLYKWVSYVPVLSRIRPSWLTQAFDWSALFEQAQNLWPLKVWYFIDRAYQA